MQCQLRIVKPMKRCTPASRNSARASLWLCVELACAAQIIWRLSQLRCTRRSSGRGCVNATNRHISLLSKHLRSVISLHTRFVASPRLAAEQVAEHVLGGFVKRLQVLDLDHAVEDEVAQVLEEGARLAGADEQ